MAISKLWAGVACLMLACLFFSAGAAQAQSRDLGAQALILDDGAGHSIRITAPTTGWTGLGQFEWVLPFPPAGLNAGFVESGTSLLTSLEWDDAGQYWKAVAGGGGTINADILALPTTTSTVGQVTINDLPFVHAYGVENTFLGQNAGNFTMTGEANTGIGYYALSANQTGLLNTAVGRTAMSSNTTASYNVAIGYAALNANTTGELNTAVGSHSLLSSSAAYSNTGVGTSTLAFNTSGSNNTAIGSQAMESSQSGNNNSALGNRALFGNTTGAENTAVGANSLYTLSTGSNNTALGSQTNVASGALTNTTAIGYQATATANNQVVLGNSAVTQVTTAGDINVATGKGITINNTAASGQYLRGDGTRFTASAIQLGDLPAGSADYIQNQNAGPQASANFNISGNGTVDQLNANIIALPATTATTGHITLNGTRFMHGSAGSLFVGAASGNFTLTGSTNTAVGTNTGASLTTGYRNVALGSGALASLTSGGDNAAVGYSALSTATTALHNTALGSLALWNTTGSSNTAIGSSALRGNTTGSGNVGIGPLVMYISTTGLSNTAVGDAAMVNNATGSYNVALGAAALQQNSTANDNTAVGTYALGISTTGTSNTAVGRSALSTLSTGNQNTALGHNTSISTGTLNNTTTIGYQATATQNNQIMLGNSSVTLIQSTGGLLLNGTTGTTPTSGAGTRLMWIPSKKAFRAGAISGTQWNDGSIGDASVAFGNSTTASGFNSTAFGLATTASGSISAAFGTETSSYGLYSTSFGEQTTSGGRTSMAMGRSTSATGDHSLAMGLSSIASGNTSIALGNTTTASGNYSTATGELTTASGAYSTAMGRRASTNSMAGSFVYGDQSINTDVANTAANQFMVRAAGGTIFYSNSGASLGVELVAGGNAWASVSDSNRKANRLIIDGEDVLNKLSNIWMGSWNYKSQDVSMRHYGPMAQEFFAAFGNDGLGVIGNDTTLATADVDGVTLIAVKALIERNDALASRVEALEAVIRQLAIERETTIHRTMMK